MKEHKLDISIAEYYNVFIKDDLRNECMERGKNEYSENDFKDYIIDLYCGWGGNKKEGESHWEKQKETVKTVLVAIGVYEPSKTITSSPGDKEFGISI